MLLTTDILAYRDTGIQPTLNSEFWYLNFCYIIGIVISCGVLQCTTVYWIYWPRCYTLGEEAFVSSRLFCGILRELVAGFCQGSIMALRNKGSAFAIKYFNQPQHRTPDVAQLGRTGTSLQLWRHPPILTSIILVTIAYVCWIDHLAQDALERTGSPGLWPATKEWTPVVLHKHASQ